MRQDNFRMDRDSGDRLNRARGSFPAYEEPNRLPDPVPDLGYIYQWIATTVGGQPALENVDLMFRSGWKPVRQDEQPHILQLTEGRSPWVRNGCIEIGGLLLCKKPEEDVLRKVRHYDSLVDGRFKSFRDSAMESRRGIAVEGEWRSYAEDGRDVRSR